VDERRQNWEQAGFLGFLKQSGALKHTIKINQSIPGGKFFISKNSKWPPKYWRNVRYGLALR